MEALKLYRWEVRKTCQNSYCLLTAVTLPNQTSADRLERGALSVPYYWNLLSLRFAGGRPGRYRYKESGVGSIKYRHSSWIYFSTLTFEDSGLAAANSKIGCVVKPDKTYVACGKTGADRIVEYLSTSDLDECKRIEYGRWKIALSITIKASEDKAAHKKYMAYIWIGCFR